MAVVSPPVAAVFSCAAVAATVTPPIWNVPAMLAVDPDSAVNVPPLAMTCSSAPCLV
jgi:hypothetical protein